MEMDCLSELASLNNGFPFFNVLFHCASKTTKIILGVGLHGVANVSNNERDTQRQMCVFKYWRKLWYIIECTPRGVLKETTCHFKILQFKLEQVIKQVTDASLKTYPQLLLCININPNYRTTTAVNEKNVRKGNGKNAPWVGDFCWTY